MSPEHPTIPPSSGYAAHSSAKQCKQGHKRTSEYTRAQTRVRDESKRHKRHKRHKRRSDKT